MKIDNNPQPISAFLSVEKDLSIITGMIMRNPRIQKLLYYTTPDCLDMDGVDEAEVYKMFGKNIRIVPQLAVEGDVLNYVIISFDSFTPNSSNPEFRNNIIEFDIICHFDQWNLGDFKLRPYKIAAEIDSMFNEKHLTGIGTLKFQGASHLILTQEYAGLCLMYEAIHGDEDKKGMPNPQDQKDFEEDFFEMLGL